MPLRDLRHIRSRGIRFLDDLPLLRRRPGFSLSFPRRTQPVAAYFHHLLQHAAHAARETYVTGLFKSMCPDRTVTVYRSMPGAICRRRRQKLSLELTMAITLSLQS